MQLLTLRELSRQQGTPAEAVPLAYRADQAGELAPLAELLTAAGRDWQRRAAHIRTSLEEGGACERCGAAVRVLVVAPCACLLCVDCAATDRERCACCASPYAMQVGCQVARGGRGRACMHLHVRAGWCSCRPRGRASSLLPLRVG